jgi:hypothetical protein
MEEVSDIVTQCFDDDEPSTHSQRVPVAVVRSCREEYLRAVKDVTQMRAFLERQSAKLRDALPSTTTRSSPTTLPVSFATDADTTHYEFVAFGDTFQTLGRHGEIRTPTSSWTTGRPAARSSPAPPTRRFRTTGAYSSCPATSPLCCSSERRSAARRSRSL